MCLEAVCFECIDLVPDGHRRNRLVSVNTTWNIGQVHMDKFPKHFVICSVSWSYFYIGQGNCIELKIQVEGTAQFYQLKQFHQLPLYCKQHLTFVSCNINLLKFFASTFREWEDHILPLKALRPMLHWPNKHVKECIKSVVDSRIGGCRNPLSAIQIGGAAGWKALLMSVKQARTARSLTDAGNCVFMFDIGKVPSVPN